MTLPRTDRIMLLVLALLVCGGVTGCVGRSAAPPAPAATPAGAEPAAAIYAQVVRALVASAAPAGGPLPRRTLYLVRQTNDAAGDPSTGPAPAAPVAAETQALITAHLADLPATIVWVDSFDAVAREAQTGQVLDDGAIIQLGTIHFASAGRALVPGSIYRNSLAASGGTYVVVREGDQWVLTGTSGPPWVS